MGKHAQGFTPFKDIRKGEDAIEVGVLREEDKGGHERDKGGHERDKGGHERDKGGHKMD